MTSHDTRLNIIIDIKILLHIIHFDLAHCCMFTPCSQTHCLLIQRWTCNQTKPPHYPSVKRTSAPCDNNNCLKEWHLWKRFASSIHMVNICMYVHVDIILRLVSYYIIINMSYVCTQFMNKYRYECVPNQLFTVFQPSQKFVRDWNFINSCLMNCDYWKNQQVQTGKTGVMHPAVCFPIC